ncbi:MAG TPA: VWA domain-containing protein [Vicinamibacterales bacterium]|nr:VWA domain-containing protein [Vicinamibacterales bacterium]
MRILSLALAAVLAAGFQRQTFKTAVDLVAVEVNVVDKDGKPIEDLKPEDFEVWISQRPRKVVTIDRRSYGSTAPAPPAAPIPGDNRAQPSAPSARRMFVLAVDEHSLQAGSAMAAMSAAERFIDKLQPDDLVGVYAYPTGTAKHDLTTDHGAAKRTLRNIMGLRVEPEGRFHMSLSEIIDCANGDPQVLRNVLQRECRGGGCSINDIRQEAIGLVGFLEMTVTQSVGALRGLARGLGETPGRKILVLVSGGLISTDHMRGRLNSSAEITEFGREAAAANLDVFALHLDWSFQEALSSKGGLRLSYFRDSNMAATGLEMVAGTAAGRVIRVRGTSPEVAFDRVLRETSAHYLLGVECSEEERDGRPHPIRVRVKRKGAEVRSRSEVIIPRR